ncbi:MAG: hypothetical protein EXS10_02625 [Phycisphaerales bacterium]|nr:hypothetical protein [Phycisphaerales bacterium]
MQKFAQSATCILVPAIIASAVLAGGAKPTAEISARGHALKGVQWEMPSHASLSRQFGIDDLIAPTVAFGALDSGLLVMEDDATPQPAPVRFAIPVNIPLSLGDGSWVEVEGGRVWRVAIEGDASLCSRIHLSGLALGAGERLTMHAPAREGSATDTYEGHGEFGTGEAWSMFTPEARAQIDWFVPAGATVKSLPFYSAEYSYGYRDVFPVERAGGGDGGIAGNCHNQPICYPAWTVESNATTRLLFGGGYLCSGQFNATTAADETPYVSTANHCISTTADANSCQFNLFYRGNTCGGAAAAGSTITGADLTVTYLASDCSLLMVRPTLPTGTGWSGWTNANPATNSASTGLHHPGGAQQAISFGVKNSSSFNCGSPSGNWNSLSWNNGITEGGSSGSAIYRDSDHKMYGVLTCGASSCANPAGDDGYGRWDLAVNSGGFATPLAAGSDDAQEQNDTCATAKALTAGTYNSLVVKRLDEDWYSLPVPNGSLLTVSMTFTHANGDVDVQIFGVCGGSVLLDRNANTNNESFSYTNTSGSSSLLMRVYLGADVRNDYSLTFSVSSPAPSNDNCVTATSVIGGSYAFSTAGATTSTPAVNNTCGASAITAIYNDVWYAFTATCTGTGTATTCGANFDSALVVYAGGACPTAASTILACNNNGTGCGTASTVSWPVTTGSTYYVRIGGGTTTTGSGNLVLACTVNCPADKNSDGYVDGADLTILLNGWGGPSGDVDGSGYTDAADIAAMLNVWGNCP